MKGTNTPAKEWLLLNACECWMHYFPNHQWVSAYQQLKDELMQELVNKTKDEQPQPKAPTQTRRPAPKAKATSTKP